MFSFIKSIFQAPVTTPAAHFYVQQVVVPVVPAVASKPLPAIRFVMDESGIRKPLGEMFAQGGEGVIHRMGDHGEIIAKIYHPEILSNPSRALRLRCKIEDMTGSTMLRSHESLAWPKVSLQDESGVWCGYAMQLSKGRCFRSVFGNPYNLATLAPHWHRQHLVRICLDFLEVIEVLARNRAIPVDFNPSNFLAVCRT